MNRRRFLQLSGLSLLANLLPATALTGCGDDGAAAPGELPLADLGGALPPRVPRAIMGFQGDEVELDLHLLSGHLPLDLQGHVFIVGAVPWGDGSPLFNGEGRVVRLDLGGERPRLMARLARSPSWYADRATRGGPMEFRNAGMIRVSGSLGAANELNTAFQVMGGRLLLTYDGGRPWEIDPRTLELVAPVGANAEWTPSLPAAVAPGPFPTYLSTAHPFWDHGDQRLYTVCYGPPIGANTGFTHLMRWDGQGSLETFRLVDERGQPLLITQSVHQLVATQDFIVLCDTAFLIEFEQIFNQDLSTPQSPDTRVLIVSKADLPAGGGDVSARLLVFPREVVHFHADYANPDDVVTLHVAHSTATDGSEWLRSTDLLYPSGEPIDAELVGLIPSGTDVNSLGRHRIHAPSGTLVESDLTSDPQHTWGVAFYTPRANTTPDRFEDMFWISVGFTDETLSKRVVDLYANHPYREIALQDLHGGRPATLFRFDTLNMKLADAWTFPPGRFGSSPTFVPSPRGGYVVCTVVADDRDTPRSSGHELWIWDATRLHSGPIARLGHPDLALGFTLHSAFLPDLDAAHPYRVDPRQDWAHALASEDPALRDLFEQHIIPHLPT